MPAALQRFRGCESGVATVEFAVISTVLLTLFAGSFDLAYMVSAARDANRASMLVAHAIATCPSSSCMPDLIYTYAKRQPNALMRYPSATVDLYMIQRQNGAIQTCFGTQSVLADADVIASAKNILRDDDVGSVAVMTMSYTSILPKALMRYINATGATYRDYTVDVMGNLGKVC